MFKSHCFCSSTFVQIEGNDDRETRDFSQRVFNLLALSRKDFEGYLMSDAPIKLDNFKNWPNDDFIRLVRNFPMTVEKRNGRIEIDIIFCHTRFPTRTNQIKTFEADKAFESLEEKYDMNVIRNSNGQVRSFKRPEL